MKTRENAKRERELESDGDERNRKRVKERVKRIDGSTTEFGICECTFLRWQAHTK